MWCLGRADCRADASVETTRSFPCCPVIRSHPLLLCAGNFLAHVIVVVIVAVVLIVCAICGCVCWQDVVEQNLLEFKQSTLDQQAERLFAMTALNVPSKARDWEGMKRCAIVTIA